ncbi:MAG: hypothetical protein ACRECH_16230 [Nitrososphaerales archaeon]
MFKLSATQKKILDFVLALAGMGVGLALQQGIIGGLTGLAGGYLVSDVISYVDTGSVQVSAIETQVADLVSKALQEEQAKQASNTAQKSA